MRQEIITYMEEVIIPKYQAFDKGHDERHVKNVIQNSLMMAKDYEVNLEMVYVIACYHDIGMASERKLHHIYSGETLLKDIKLKNWFSETDILIMKEAVEDHRASNDYPPRSIYGKIVAEADRDINYTTVLYRCIQYRLKDQKQVVSFDAMFDEIASHIEQKYGEKGYLKLWLNSENNLQGLKELQQGLKNLDTMKKDCFEIYQEIVND